MRYHIDIVLCIDCTGSMGKAIGYAKEMALNFHQDLFKYMKHVQKNPEQVRVKVIGFRDIYDATDKANGLKSFEESDFFLLPEQYDKLQTFVMKLSASGGGDEPESALEALAMAIKSKWDQGGDKRRHVIVVWTDAPAHKLEKTATTKPLQGGDPTRTAATFDVLTDWWHGGEFIDKGRIALFAPDLCVDGKTPAYPWPEIADSWERVIWHKSQAGEGLGDLGYAEIIARLAQSLD